MAEREFPGNNPKAQPLDAVNPLPQGPKERVKKVEAVEGLGEVQVKKPTLGQRFKSTFFGGDAKQTAKDVWASVIVPMMQNTLLDAIQQGSERMIGGQVRTRPSMGGTIPNLLALGHHAYKKMYSNGPMPANNASPLQQMQSRQQRATHDFSNFVVANRARADPVGDRMHDLLSRDGAVTVADFMDLLSEPADYTMQKWGWVDLRGTQIVRVPQGFLIALPRPVPLD